MGNSNNSTQSHQQSGAQYFDSISLSSLKNKIDLIRGTKKVKTTKELLAELQNRKAQPTTDDNNAMESQSQSNFGDGKLFIKKFFSFHFFLCFCLMKLMALIQMVIWRPI